MVNRWRLEKSDHRAKLSPPKKQILWYVEDTVPHEYRPYVEEGIREWNKAFEKIGFRDAISVRWQEPGRDDFDPEDINYCTFRWITTNMTYAMSCLRSNPMTGEMIDGDVIFDASWIRAWKQEYAFLTGCAGGVQSRGWPGQPDDAAGRRPDPQPDPGRQGRFRPADAAAPSGSMPHNDLTRSGETRPELIPSNWNDLEIQLRRRQSASQFNACQLSHGMRPELGLAALALATIRTRTRRTRKEKDDASKIPSELAAS